MLGAVSVDQCGNMVAVETTSHGHTTGLSVLISPADWLELVAKAETLALVRAERLRQRAMREAASHHARRSP